MYQPPAEAYTGGDVFARRPNDNWELLKAWAGSTLAYAIFITGIQQVASAAFLESLVIAGVVCGLAFVLHELAHRVVARGFGAEAHFIADNRALLISIAIAAAGIFIAAPGAVWHRGTTTARQGGLIALAGPVVNLVLSVIFFVALIAMSVSNILAPEWLYNLLYIGFSFNAWLGLFNMIPAGPFDGAKVFAWNKIVFGITVVAALFLAFGLRNETVLNWLFGILR